MLLQLPGAVSKFGTYALAVLDDGGFFSRLPPHREVAIGLDQKRLGAYWKPTQLTA